MCKGFLPLFLFITAIAHGQRGNMPLLHAERGIHAGLYDPQERIALLRGVNYNALGEYWQGVADAPSAKAYEDSDLILMEKYGFNCVRMLFTWSRLEPRRGYYDTAYVSRIRHAIEVAGQYHLYVLLDMHQDAWGMYVATTGSETCGNGPARGWDGAPQWATLSNGLSTCAPRSRESAPAVVQAFGSFLDDRDSLQEHCINGWALLVTATAGYSNVLGYDLLNEPGLGDYNILRESILLGRYYTKLMHAIRKAEFEAGHPQHVILFEPSVTWRGRDYPSVPLASFRHERNILFSPHHYFESISNALTIKQGFGLMKFVTRWYRTGMLIGEWGFFNGPRDTLKISRYTQLEDKYMLGSTWWQWSQACGDPHSISWNGKQWQAPDYSMHLIELDRHGHRTGKVNQPVMNILNRCRPVAVAGRTRGFKSNPDTGEMCLKGRSRHAGTVSVYIPARFGMPVVDGRNAAISKTETIAGGICAEVAVHGKYVVHVLGR